MRYPLIACLVLAVGSALAAAPPVIAQNSGQNPPSAPPAPPAALPETASLPVYKPPLRGAPGGRVGGASRSAAVPAGGLPVVELLAPADSAGLTARPDPTLYFYISRPSRWPAQFTISAPLQPAPVIEAMIPTPSARGIYAMPTAQYHVHLQPGIVYTWSVSLVLDPRAWSHNIVASATIVFDPTLAPTASIAAPTGRAADLAQAGLWYDAVAEAAAEQDRDRRAALDALMRQIGLTAAVADQRTAITQ